LPQPEKVLTYRTGSHCMKGGKPVDVSNSITPVKGERLTDIQPKFRWTDIAWKKVETHVNRLQTRITKAVKLNCCPIQKGL